MYNLNTGQWLNRPKEAWVKDDLIQIKTDPGTDFWQNTYYQFVHTNASAYIFPMNEDHTFTVKTAFQYRELFDQCGVLLYLNEQNWAKVSIERENETRGWLGSVVTNLGYSDWATVSISGKPVTRSYRLSRRGADFLFEQSDDGVHFDQMRIFHMHALPRTPLAGIYACSPKQSSFVAEFSEFVWEPCLWKPHA